MSLPRISPIEAKRLLDGGAMLVDIRERDEYARERISAARNLPLSILDREELGAAPGQPVIFHCWSGVRTLGNAAPLAAKAGSDCQAYLLDGGLQAWKAAGLPAVADFRQPIELQRQVQIAAGSLALLGALLGLLVSSWFFALPAVVGAGLIAAGVSGFCGMARVLKAAPWNRRSYAAARAR